MKGRSTGELLVLMIAGTICSAVLIAVVGIGLLEITNPEENTERAVAAVSDVINTLIGLLAGFLAGRTDRGQRDNESNNKL